MAVSLLANLKKRHDAYASARRKIIAASGEAQSLAKRSIFALQRGDAAEGETLLERASVAVEKARAAAKDPSRLAQEGSLRAALEEYAEAAFFAMFLKRGKVAALAGLDEETQIGGLCDMLGEVVRRMTALATAGDYEEAARLKKAAEPVMTGLTEMDYSGYLRTKYDQAVRHFRRMEEILYDIALRTHAS